MDLATIVLSTFFGAIGMGYIVYGKRQQKGIPLLVGILLGIFPFFVSNPWLSLLIGIGLMFLPKLIEL